MDLLKIEKNLLIKKLLEDNKVDVVRNAILSQDYDSMIKKERLNYCSDKELIKIVKDKSLLAFVINNYTLNDKIIDMIVDECFEDNNIISLLIVKFLNKIYPKHLDSLLKKMKYRKLILENNNKLNDESVIYLHSKNMLKKLESEQMLVVAINSLKDANPINVSGDKGCFLPYIKKYSDEEIEKVLLEIFEYDNVADGDLYKKGYLDNLVGTQKLPAYAISKVVREWDYNVDEPWFEKILLFQNLEGILDYILENKKLTDNSIFYIINNKKTPKRELCRFYETHAKLIVEASIHRGLSKNKKNMNLELSSALPVLDCHNHLC